jgi:hypothetical protein
MKSAQPLRLDKADAVALDAAQAVWRAPGRVWPLWPAPLNESTPEAAWQFVQELRTWNEAEGAVQPFPEKPYLRELACEWVNCRHQGRPLIVEKCRRMVVSWLFRALELHAMGLGRTDLQIAGIDYEAAAKHVWRLRHLYEDLRSRRPEWNLPASHSLKAKGERQLEQFDLANGSLCTMLNQESSSIQGEGVSIVCLEELSRYRYPASMWAQARIVTKGSPGSLGGFVVAVCNAYPNEEWTRIKGEG